MPVTSLRTRLQIRQSVGMGLNAIDQSGGSNTLQVTGGSSSDAWTVGALTMGATDEHRGKWAIATGGSSAASSNIGFIRRVSASASSNGRLTYLTNWPVAADTSQTFELWKEFASPTLVHNYINQAISEATKKGAVAYRELFHTGGNLLSYGLSSGSSAIGVQEIEYRSRWTGEQVTSLDTVMSSAANVLAETDSANKREGAASARINIAAGFSSATVAATSSFGAIDARKYTHLEFWALSNITVTSSALQARLGEGSTNRETISMPALNADSWTYLRLVLANPETDSAITRFMLMTGASDAGSMTVWVDDVKFVRDATEEWTRLNRRFWGLDQTNRAVVFEGDARVPYALIKATVRRAPNLLTTDSAICEVDPDYVINSVTGKLLRSRSDLSGGARDAALQEADRYEARALKHYLSMGTPQGVRWLETR